jgi:hypothetical protein
MNKAEQKAKVIEARRLLNHAIDHVTMGNHEQAFALFEEAQGIVFDLKEANLTPV